MTNFLLLAIAVLLYLVLVGVDICAKRLREIREELSRINYNIHSAAHPAKDPDFVRGDGASL